MLGIFDTTDVGGCCYGRFCKNVLYVSLVVHIFQILLYVSAYEHY